MDKYTKAVLTVIALCMLALPVKAEEKIYICEIHNVDVTTVKDKTVILQNVEEGKKFSLRVTPEKLFFGSGVNFFRSEYDVIYYSDPNSWRASNSYTTIAFMYGEFYFAHADHMSSTGIAALCEDV